MSEASDTTIVFCLRNVDRSTLDWFYALASDRPDLDIRACGCLSRCSTCVDTAFLMIDGHEVEGESHQQIIADMIGPSPEQHKSQ